MSLESSLGSDLTVDKLHTSSTDSKSSFLSIDTLLKKEKEPSKSLQSPSLFPAPDQMTKTLDEQKPWFSILPRMPCDDLSVAQVTCRGNIPILMF
jgi:hypothetical protein